MKPARPGSLQARLLAFLLALVTVIWLGAASFTWYDVSHELDELLDGHLAQAAALLVAQQNTADEDDGIVDAPSLHKYAPKVAFQVFYKGRLVMRSTNAGTIPMSETALGFSTVRLSDGANWRVFATRGLASDVQVYVGEQTASRNSILWAVLRNVLWPLAFALPLLALANWWAVQRGLAPLRLLSQVLGQRRPQALEPVELADMPTEMRPLVQAINGLFQRVGQMLAFERRFTADAAHELRTPIAGIRAQAQVALGAADDAAQREHALQATLAGCDRATRLVEQLLTLARLEAAPGATELTFDLTALARRITADLAPAALANRQIVALDGPAPCTVSGDEMLIGVLARNLIDNAIRYSPAGARIQVQVGRQSGQPFLCVQDSGPGMTEPEMTRLGERFFRVLGHDKPGSGLGWSIVKRIADVFAIALQVSRSQALGGLAVTARWPPVQSS